MLDHSSKGIPILPVSANLVIKQGYIIAELAGKDAECVTPTRQHFFDANLAGIASPKPERQRSLFSIRLPIFAPKLRCPLEPEFVYPYRVKVKPPLAKVSNPFPIMVSHEAG